MLIPLLHILNSNANYLNFFFLSVQTCLEVQGFIFCFNFKFTDWNLPEIQVTMGGPYETGTILNCEQAHFVDNSPFWPTLFIILLEWD